MRVNLDPSFQLDLPAGWSADTDEEGGIAVTGPEAAGLLHVIAFEQAPGELLDPAEELYIFLEDQGIELEEDEIEDAELEEGSDLSLCEYLSEEEDDEDQEGAETTYWLVAVATAPGNLVFASYTCAAEDADVERETIRAILRTLRLAAVE